MGCLLWLRELGVTSLSDDHLQAITRYEHADNSIVLDRSGRKIGEFFSRYNVFIGYQDIPPFLIDAVTAIEDRSFFSHPGVDVRGIARAALVHITGRPYSQGASTITQQIVRHFLLSPEKTLERKVREIALSLRLERSLPKEKIFEIYANALFLGNGAYGVGAAAQRYFAKNIGDLEDHELAVIAGLFQSPSRYNPHRYPERAKARQLKVLAAMLRSGSLSREEYRRLSKRALHYRSYENISRQTAPYFTDYVRDQVESILDKNIKNQGLRIHTTLDSDLQAMAQAAIAGSHAIFSKAEAMAQSQRSGPKKQVEAALLATSPQTGEILAMVGGRDYTQSQFNRTVSALRSPGSAFKPVVFAAALSRGFKWSDIDYVSPVAVDDYRPRNVDGVYLGETTLLRAFAKSINTTTIELGAKIGIPQVIKTARDLGIKSPIREESGSIIGASEVTVLEMTTMYGSFANLGKRVDPVAVIKVTDRDGKVLYEAPSASARTHDALVPQVAYLMIQGMRSVLLFGSGSSHREWARFAAGKTGTSNEARDNWFCGFTPNLVAIAWLGTDSPDGFLGPAGGNTLALPIWDAFMRAAIRHVPPPPFTVPEGITMAKVHPQYGYIDDNGVEMYFTNGKTPTQNYSALPMASSAGGYRSLFYK